MADSTTLQIDAAFASVLKALDPQDLKKSMRGANRKEANRIRKIAVSKIATTGVLSPKNKKHRKDSKTTAQQFGKSIFVRVYPDKYGSGFMVSVFPFKKKGYHKNRQGQEKPAALWLEEGTRFRRVGKRQSYNWYTSRHTQKKQKHYNRSGHSTGFVQAYGFMAKAEAEVGNSVEVNLFKEFEKNVEKAARKQRLL